MRRLLLPFVVVIAACSGGSASSPKVFPAMLYLGVEDTGARYEAPVALDGAGPMAYSIADATIATASAGDKQLEVGALRVGSTSVTVRSDFGEASADVAVTTYLASDRLAGAQAWNTFNCASCHDFGSDVTPSGIARRTDAQITAAITAGVSPDGGQISGPHSFAIASSDPAFVGIAAFLRSLPARGIPTADP